MHFTEFGVPQAGFVSCVGMEKSMWDFVEGNSVYIILAILRGVHFAGYYLILGAISHLSRYR